MRRIGIYGPSGVAALALCIAAVQMAGAKPAPRADQHFNPHPSQKEGFDAVLVVGGSTFAPAIAGHYSDEHVPVATLPPEYTPDDLVEALHEIGFTLTDEQHAQLAALASGDSTAATSGSVSDSSATGTETGDSNTSPNDDGDELEVVDESKPATDPHAHHTARKTAAKKRATRGTKS